jgi:hypothetical protein
MHFTPPAGFIARLLKSNIPEGIWKFFDRNNKDFVSRPLKINKQKNGISAAGEIPYPVKPAWFFLPAWL